MCDGRVLRGHLGRAGHLGHMSLDPAGVLDIVNTPGSLEDAVGECSIAKRCGGRFKSNRELVAAYRRGDEQAAGIWLAAIKSLAAALASFTNLFDPEIIVIGGGIARAGAALFEPLEQQVRQFEWTIGDFRVPIVPAQLGKWSGAFGAAWQGMNADTVLP
jgi:glucokinase